MLASGLTYNEDGPRETWELRSGSPEQNAESNPSKLSQNSTKYSWTEKAEISLVDSNLVVGLLPNGRKFNIVIDSGASLTLLGQDVVDSSPYLSQLPLEKIEPVKICIADGNFIYTEFKINFECQIQGFHVPLSAHIVPPFGLVNCLLGTPDLKRLRATIDLERDILKLSIPKSKVVKFNTTSAFYIRPHSTRLITLKAKLPAHFSNGEIELKATKTSDRLTAAYFLTTVRKGKCVVPMHNDSDKTIQVSRHSCLAVTDFDNLCQPVSRSEFRQQKLAKYPFLESDDCRLNLPNTEILDRDIDLDTDCILDDRNKIKFKEVLHQLEEAFSLHGEVGDCRHEVEFDMTDTQPFYIRPYSVCEKEKEIIDKELDKLVKMGILEQGVTSSSSPVMLVRKKDGKCRIVSDLRFLNSKIRKQNWPFPLIKDSIQKLGMSQCTVLSTIDLKDAFHSLRLSRNSQKHAGICSYFGGRSYFYKRLPQGASLSPCQFQSFLETVLDEIPDGRDHIIAHMDDIIIFSQDQESHTKHIQALLKVLIKHGLKVSPTKSHFFRHSLEYMGHVIKSQDGRLYIQAMRSKCDAIRRIRRPTTIKEVRSFAGGVNYLAMYLPRLQELLVPLHKLTKTRQRQDKRKNFSILWSQECQQNFDKIKELLVQPPILAMPQYGGQLKLYSDTSRIATGSSLCQIVDGQEILLSYHSKALPEAASRYSVTELEFWGLAHNVETYRNLLKQGHFIAVVDHSALVQVLRSKKEPPTMRMKKIIERLTDYSFTIEYQKGESLVISDLLSRMCEPHAEDNPSGSPDSEDTLGIPIACANRPVTRAFAKNQGISVQQDLSAYPSDRKTKSKAPVTIPIMSDDSQCVVTNEAENGSCEDLPSETVEPHSVETTHPFNPPIRHVQPSFVPPHEASPARGRPTTLVETKIRQTGGKNVMPIPRDSLIPENTVPSDPEIFETHNTPGPPLYRDPQPLFSLVRSDQIIQPRNVPRQKQINLLLDQIRLVCLRDFNLPLKAAEIKRELRSSPYFQNIYQYMTTGLLPSGKRAAQSVLREAENHILVQGVLFKIAIPDGSLKLRLCIPESQCQYIMSLYHDSLLSCHQGVSRSFHTIKAKYFIPGLYDKLVAYIRSCAVCQQRKLPQARDNSPPLHPRIFSDYIPFAEIHIDLKSMYRSSEGYEYLLVMTCVQTRFVIALPVKKIDCLTISEAVLQRVVFLFGVPRKIVSDRGTSFANKVFQYILKTLQIESQFVSPYNHGSLVVERSIQSLSGLLLSQLQGHGRNWPLYINCTCHAYNTFSHSLLGGYSPFELAFLRTPPDYLNIKFPDDQSMSVTYQEYIDRLKVRFNSIASMVISLQNAHQEKQAIKHDQKARRPAAYSPGQLVYMLMPAASDLQTNTRKFKVSYVGPLKIKEMLDPTHVILEDLNGALIYGIHNVRRLKPAFIRSSEGNLGQFHSLYKKFDPKAPVKESLSIVSEDGTPHKNIDKCHFVFKAQGTEHTESQAIACTAQTGFEVSEQDLAAYYIKDNDGLACSHVLNTFQQRRMVKTIKALPAENAEIWATKSKYVNGSLQVLFTSHNGDFASWYDLSVYPELGKCFPSDQSFPNVQGSAKKFSRALYAGEKTAFQVLKL